MTGIYEQVGIVGNAIPDPENVVTALNAESNKRSQFKFAGAANLTLVGTLCFVSVFDYSMPELGASRLFYSPAFPLVSVVQGV